MRFIEQLNSSGAVICGENVLKVLDGDENQHDGELVNGLHSSPQPVLDAKGLVR